MPPMPTSNRRGRSWNDVSPCSRKEHIISSHRRRLRVPGKEDDMRAARGLMFAGGLGTLAFAQSRSGATLSLYLVDVEGGNATLIVSPAGESLLIDTGNGGAAAMRDADRIMAAARDANLKQIDHLITTHYHGDHFGGM